MTPILGFRVLFQYKGLFWYFLLPIVFQTLLSLLLLAFFYGIGSFIAGWIEWLVEWSTLQISSLTGQPESIELSPWAATAIKVAIWTPIVLTAAYIFIIIWRLTGGVLTGYFGGRLTDKAMKFAGFEFDVKDETTFLNELMNSWLTTAWIAIPASIIGTVFNIIPVVGSFLAIPVIWLFASFITGVDELRDPLKKFGKSRVQIFQICNRNRAATIGIGLAKMASEPIPLIGGLVQASEALGRIYFAMRILEADPVEPGLLPASSGTATENESTNTYPDSTANQQERYQGQEISILQDEDSDATVIGETVVDAPTIPKPDEVIDAAIVDPDKPHPDPRHD